MICKSGRGGHKPRNLFLFQPISEWHLIGSSGDKTFISTNVFSLMYARRPPPLPGITSGGGDLFSG
jgi:hypothetical protein